MKTSENSIIVQNVNSIDQIEHQTIITEDGRAIDLDQKHFDIIDEDGHIVFDADGKVLASIAKEELTYENFDSIQNAILTWFEDNIELYSSLTEEDVQTGEANNYDIQLLILKGATIDRE